MKFIFPIDGDCINERDGKKIEGGIVVPVRVKAEEGRDIVINEVKAVYRDGEYVADVLIGEFRSFVTAKDTQSGERVSIAVFDLGDVTGKYRISVDDNILFLADITRHKDEYKSIFDNPYLALYKRAHDLYGACVNLNLFYEFRPDSQFSTTREYFSLTMMTDKFKGEFIANSDWLTLSFHANSEYPNRPYKFTESSVIREDFIKVSREIIRFAGKETLADSTTVHWGEATKESAAELRSLGNRALAGYFKRSQNGEPLVSYYFDGELLDHMEHRDFMFDKDIDVFFGRIDIVMNLNSLEWVKSEIASIVDDPTRGGYIDAMIHEQYFYPDYVAYKPDFEERIMYVCKYLYDRGYKPMKLAEAIREPSLYENAKFN